MLIFTYLPFSASFQTTNNTSKEGAYNSAAAGLQSHRLSPGGKPSCFSLGSACRAAGASDAMAGLILRRSSAAIFNCWFSQSVQAVV